MSGADFLFIGGGIAGLSAGSRLARHGRVLVLEAEQAIGYHSSGRSVSFSHFGIGNATVRGLTAHSQTFFNSPPDGFCPTDLCKQMATLYFAEEAALQALDQLGRAMSEFTDAIETIGAAEMTQYCPVLRTGPGAAVQGLIDPTGLKLDTDALLQSYARDLRTAGGIIRNGSRVCSIEQAPHGWLVRTEDGGAFEAPILVNAAGAWADRIAVLAGVEPLGLRPKRRTIISVDAPDGVDPGGWPFVHSAGNDFYMMPEAGRLLVSPVDEIDDDPCDAQPEDYDLALAADRLEHYTVMTVRRIAHRWAGLRTFTADRVPTAGFASDAPGFFWLVGQGGYGFQTAPAMADIVEQLITNRPWPAGLVPHGVEPSQIRPERLKETVSVD